MENEFYVYVLVDSRTDEIFYVGRGKNKRAWVHLRPSQLKESSPKNKLIKEILNSNKSIEILIVDQYLSFQESLDQEKRLIEILGRETLTNRTSGGQGLGSGVKSFLGRTHSLESRKKLSLSKKGSNNPMFGEKWHRSPSGVESFRTKISGINHPLFDKEHTKETKDKIRNTLIGIKLSEEQKEIRRIGMIEVWNKRRNGLIPMPVKKKK